MWQFQQSVIDQLNARQYWHQAVITPVGGTAFTVDESRIWQGSFEIDRAISGQSKFEVGSCVVGELKLELDNHDGAYDSIVFNGAEVVARIQTYNFDQNGDPVPDATFVMGHFYVVEVDTNGNRVALTCYDAMFKFDIPLTEVSGVPFAMTYWQLLSGMCTEAGVTTTVTQTSMQNMRYAISGISSYMLAIPQGYTEMSCRDALADMCASIGAYAYINEAGQLVIEQFDDAWLKETSTSHTYYENNYAPYFHDFTPANMTKFNRDEENVTISGATVIDGRDREFSAGTAGYVIELDKNWCIWTTDTGTVSQAYANGLNTMLGGATFRPFKASHIPDLSMQLGDRVLITDARGHLYKSIVLHMKYKAWEMQETECAAESAAIVNGARYTSTAQAIGRLTAELLPYDDTNTLLNVTNTQAAIEAVYNSIPKPVTLFTGDSTGDVPLSSSAANYSMLEIFFEGYNGANPQSIKVISPNGRTVNLSITQSNSGSSVMIRVSRYTISGTAMTLSTEANVNGYIVLRATGNTWTTGSVIHVTRVDGYV